MSSRRGPSRSGADDGFTLVELILAVLILGVITVPLGNVVIGFLQNTDATTGRLLESRDVQIASAYWAQDVASIGTRSPIYPYPLTRSVETRVPYASSLFPCGTAGTTPIVTLAWDETTAPGATTLVRVAYVVQTNSVSGQRELHRLRCEGSPTAVSDVTLAHGIDPTISLTTPAWVTCSTACAAAPNVPRTVRLTLTLKDPGNRATAYRVTLTGQRRQS